jgi:hypothetical protein
MNILLVNNKSARKQEKSTHGLIQGIILVSDRNDESDKTIKISGL